MKRVTIRIVKHSDVAAERNKDINQFCLLHSLVVAPWVLLQKEQKYSFGKYTGGP
jgi:hypothetical protein